MIINVLGCMGIGKSTKIKLLSKKYPTARIIKEEFESNPYWVDAYSGKDPEFLKMQITFLNQYVNNLSYKFKDELVIMDQQLLAGPQFVKTQNEMGLISNRDAKQYMIRFNMILNLLMRVNPEVKDIINLVLIDSDENIMNKLKSRGREEESNIGIDFIKKLNTNFKTIGINFEGLRFKFINMEGIKKEEIPRGIIKIIDGE